MTQAINQLHRILSATRGFKCLHIGSKGHLGYDKKSWMSERDRFRWGGDGGMTFANAYPHGKVQHNQPSFVFTFTEASGKMNSITSGLAGFTFFAGVSDSVNQIVSAGTSFGDPATTRFELSNTGAVIRLNDSDSQDTTSFTDIGTSSQIIAASVDVPNTTINVYENGSLHHSDTTFGTSGRSTTSTGGSQRSRLGPLSWSGECEYFFMAWFHRALSATEIAYLTKAFNTAYHGRLYT